MAMAMLITASGAPAASTARSIVGESTFASPTTATRETSSSPKLAQDWAFDGGCACASSFPAFETGRK